MINDKNIFKHCGVTYKVITEYTDEIQTQVIEVNGTEYKLSYIPRPCKNESDLRKVFCNGIEYSNFAKFLKSIK
jgi:hypothetical protein